MYLIKTELWDERQQEEHTKGRKGMEKEKGILVAGLETENYIALHKDTFIFLWGIMYFLILHKIIH
jgi:hypothetical protein